MEIKRICIVGPGRMGVGIATALLMCDQGYKITLVDTKNRRSGQRQETLKRALKEIENNIALLRDLKQISVPRMQMEKSLTFSTDLESAAGQCHLVFETLPEKPDLKQNFIKRIEPCLSSQAIIASATSTISLETFWDVSQRPDKIIITHWLNPAFIIPLVEVSVGAKTSDRTVNSVRRFLMEARKLPVSLKDSPGFIVPRIQVAAMNEAVRILEEGIATPEEIDTAIKAGFGFRLAVLGIIEFIDLGGVDILYHAGNFLNDKLSGDHYSPPESVISKMNKGEVGPTSGKGFFDYRDMQVDEMFRKRYQGFLELLKTIKESANLSFNGGINQ